MTTPHTITYNARAFLIDGNPELLLSACIHYFRVPAALWADRIARAKRGGMNTIETYVAWNVHEPAPGTFHFAGDADLEAFLKECERQGMYVIVRPGPYICAEWDYGGFPAWLQTLPGIAFRTDNKPYLDAVDRWFDVLVPLIERHQWTRGGTVLLVQVENEYANLRWTRGAEMPTDDIYQRYIRDALLKRGIDVPLITCVGPCEGTVECINGHHPADQMPDFRATYPDAPLFVTEFWTGWYDAWGLPHHQRSAANLEYASWRCWAEAAGGYNYYVYHGGTHFGYSPMYRQTTSYDYDAPLSETGRPTDKWRACRRVALFAHTFKEILTTGEHRVSKAATNGLRATEITNRERGSVLFVDNPDHKHTVTGSVLPYLPEITLGPQEMFAYVHDAVIPDRQEIQLGTNPPPGASDTASPVAAPRYLSAYAGLVKSDARVLTAHLRPDPFSGARVYVYGTSGETREVVLFYGGGWGESIQVTFTDTPTVVNVGPSQVVTLTTEQAGRTFFPQNPEDSVLIGADDATQQEDGGWQAEVAPGATHTLFMLSADGTVTAHQIEAPLLPELPRVSVVESVALLDVTNPEFDDSHWQELDDIATEGNLIRLNIATRGAEHGSDPYGWYRSVVTTDEPMDATLHFAACSDRLTLWLNGERIGSSPIPPEDRRSDWGVSFAVRLREGKNVFCVLADGLGLVKGDWQIGKGQEQEKKGIYGPVTLTPAGGCYLVDITRWRFAPGPNTYDDVMQSRAIKQSGSQTGLFIHRLTFSLAALPPTAAPIKVRLAGMGKGVFWLNGINMGRYWCNAGETASHSAEPYIVAEWLEKQGITADHSMVPQAEYYLPEPYLKVGDNELALLETEGKFHDGRKITLVRDDSGAVLVTDFTEL